MIHFTESVQNDYLMISFTEGGQDDHVGFLGERMEVLSLIWLS